jgi:hypothetical protein
LAVKLIVYINYIKTRGSKGLKKFRKGTALLVLAIFVAEMFLSSMTAYAFGMPKSSNAVTEASVTDNLSVEIVKSIRKSFECREKSKKYPQVTEEWGRQKPMILVRTSYNGQAKNQAGGN